MLPSGFSHSPIVGTEAPAFVNLRKEYHGRRLFAGRGFDEPHVEHLLYLIGDPFTHSGTGPSRNLLVWSGAWVKREFTACCLDIAKGAVLHIGVLA